MNHFSWLRVHFILICINYVSSSSYSIKWLHISLLHHTFGLTAHTHTHYTSGERNRGSKCSSISNGNHTIMRRIHTWASVKQQHFHHLIWFDLRFRFSLFAFICNFLSFFREQVKKKVHYIVLVCCNLGLLSIPKPLAMPFTRAVNIYM